MAPIHLRRHHCRRNPRQNNSSSSQNRIKGRINEKKHQKSKQINTFESKSNQHQAAPLEWLTLNRNGWLTFTGICTRRMHVESFNKTLGKAIEFNTFNNLKSLEDRLVTFYECYNNDRSHGSTKGIPPAKFWTLFEQNQIEVITLPKHRIKFKVKVKYQDILLLEGIEKHDYRAKMNSE